MKDILVELGTEELPPKSLLSLSKAFGASIEQQLKEAELSFASIKLYATPRRLAVVITNVLATQADKAIERRGPPTKIAYDGDGNLTKAGKKFAETCGITPDQIETTKTDKGEWLYYKGMEPGKQAKDLLPGFVDAALSALPIPKRMRWGNSDTEFVRPVHWAVMLWGSEVLDSQLIDMPTGRTTFGHRFHAPQEIEIEQPAAYESILQDQGWVIADFAKRRQLISEMIESTAESCHGAVVADEELLDEITALVEWPVPVAGEYDKRFLELPPEVLISTLKDHQRYFPVVNKTNGEILPWFITVSNIKSTQPEQVKLGNERVVTPRLADAEFFWQNDLKKSLADRIPDLDAVVFQKRLGSLAEKVGRVELAAISVSDNIGGNANLVKRAVSLSKCDLMTGMVGEFPDLQGIMGQYYAKHDGETDEVASAMAEQYLPRFAKDQLPTSKTGQALAIADRIDTITSIFGLGQKPTGTKDPFGLRRAALGVLRIMIESKLDINLRKLINSAATAVLPKVNDVKKPAYNTAEELTDAVFGYMTERLRGYFLDDAKANFSADMFEAVRVNQPERPLDFVQRMNAVREFMRLPESESLAAANKRIANILKSAKDNIPSGVDASQLHESSEKALYQKIQTVKDQVEPMRQTGQYQESLQVLAELRAPVDDFFDNVMVMADDEQLRLNRLALLSDVRSLFLHTADISKLQ